jgi:hypothetical protein
MNTRERQPGGGAENNPPPAINPARTLGRPFVAEMRALDIRTGWWPASQSRRLVMTRGIAFAAALWISDHSEG